jgi:hypothetical protein
MSAMDKHSSLFLQGFGRKDFINLTADGKIFLVFEMIDAVKILTQILTQIFQFSKQFLLQIFGPIRHKFLLL